MRGSRYILHVVKYLKETPNGIIGLLKVMKMYILEKILDVFIL
jgi:hypothetical protein